jgi:hypothetical protein
MHDSDLLLRRVTPIMRSFTFALRASLLSFCAAGLTGCGEDNEALSVKQGNTASVDSSKVPPPAKSPAEYFKNNPGSGGAGTDKTTGYPGRK